MPPGALLDRVGEQLQAAGVAHCQWKGHWKRARWESGAGDVDLLVDAAASQLLSRTLSALGFKPALPPPEAQLAGTESWFGYDTATGVLLHIHVHFRLIVGSYWTTLYRLPIERAVLATAIPHRPFPIPAPETELLLFALRQVQRGGWRDPGFGTDVQRELAYLQARIPRGESAARAGETLLSCDVGFVEACLGALAGGMSRRRRIRLRRGLHAQLRQYARRPPFMLLLKRIGRRLHLVPRARGMRFAGGGTVFALLGGDGAGKSTCVAKLEGWLADSFDLMTAHLGRPPRSLTTLLVGGLLKLQRTMGVGRRRPTGTLELARLVCTARDRYLLFRSVRRHAAQGGVALCERYPTPHEPLLVGPEITRLLGSRPPTRLERRLARAEQAYYDRIAAPDVTMVMLVDPEIAVRRKTTEPPDYVRTRNRIVWNTDWSATDARIVDAGRPLDVVLADLRTLIWSEL
jgi:thymidylate kinase